jgi:hypothetical protein
MAYSREGKSAQTDVFGVVDAVLDPGVGAVPRF